VFYPNVLGRKRLIIKGGLVYAAIYFGSKSTPTSIVFLAFISGLKEEEGWNSPQQRSDL